MTKESREIIDQLIDLTKERKLSWEEVTPYLVKTESIDGIVIYISYGGPGIFALTFKNRGGKVLVEWVTSIGFHKNFAAFRRLWALARNYIYEEEILQKISKYSEEYTEKKE